MIRKASIDDLEALYNIEKTCFGKERYSKNFIAYLLQAENTITLVYSCAERMSIRGIAFSDSEVKEENAHIIGSITFSFNKIMRIISIAVLPEFRRRGIGKALLKEAEKLAREKGIDKIILEVGVRNSAALNFYLANDYKIDFTIPNYYPNQDGYRMSKKLCNRNSS